MKKHFRLSGRIIPLLIIAAVLLCSCNGFGSADETSAGATTPADVTLSHTPEDNYKASVAVLNGTTGFGIAPLYDSLKNGKVGYLKSIDFYADPTLISPLIIQGSADIAAVPTNLASVLFNKTEGKVRVVALNTLGVLYLLENGNSVSSVADLKGKTVYVPGQGSNPEYILRALLSKSGLEDSVTIDYTYTSPDELTTAAVTGKAALSLLPEPKISAALTKNSALRVALDISEEWKSFTGTDLIQGCLIAREDFCLNHPAVLQRFLEDYSASVEALTKDPEKAADIIVNVAGLAPSTQLVTSALPRCNIVCITGSDMIQPLNQYWTALFDIIPSSVGGAVPTDKIFFK